MSEILLLDPGDNVIVTFDWTSQLPAGVTLSAVTHTVDAPLTKGAEEFNAGTGISTVKVSGVLHGGLYMVAGQATLSNGEVINRQAPIRGWNS